MKKIIATIAAALIVLLGATACEDDTSADSSAQSSGQELTEQAYEQQAAAVPYPADQLRDSLERANLRDRLIRTNKPTAIGYVYLMNFGKIVGYYTIEGKVSSTQSQMTTNNLVIDCSDGQGCSDSVVDAPGDDGSYGSNEPGIFFFTTEGVMVTTDLNYIWSDAVLPIDVPRLG